MAKIAARGDAKALAKRKNERSIACLVLLLIIAFGVAISIRTTLGPNMLLGNSDDFYTLADANIIAHHGFSQDYLGLAPFSVSYLFEGVPAFFMAVFGSGLISESMLGIISLIGTMVAIFLIGKNLKDERAGLIAALAFVLVPLIAAQGATPGNGIPNAFMTTLAVLFLLLGIKKKEYTYYAASGFVGFVGAIVGSVEVLIVLVFLVPVLMYLLLKDRGREQIIRTASFFAGILLGILFVAVLSYVLQSNPSLYFIHTFGLGTYLISKQPEIGIILPQLLPTNSTYLYNALTFSGNTFNVVSGAIPTFYEGELFSLWGYALIAGSLYLLVKRRRYAAFAFSWFMMIFLFLSFGKDDLSLMGYMAYNTKFLPIMVPPMAVMVGLALSDFIDAKILQKAKSGKSKSPLLWGIPVLLVSLACLMIIANSFNMMGYLHEVNNVELYTTTQMANFLSGLPKSASVYVVSGLENNGGNVGASGSSGGIDPGTIRMINYLAWTSIEPYGRFDLNLNYSSVFEDCEDLNGNYFLSFGYATTEKELEKCNNLADVFTPEFNSSLVATATESNLSLVSGMILYKKA